MKNTSPIIPMFDKKQLEFELKKYNLHCADCKCIKGKIDKREDGQYINCNVLGEVKLIRIGEICIHSKK